MVNLEYNYLLNQVYASNCTREMFERIKHLIKEDIKSKRRFENLNSVQDIILILEKRDLINVTDVTYLRNIARMLNINDYVPTIVASATYNTPVLKTRSEIKLQQQVESPVLNLEPETFRQQIFNLVGEEIGGKWKNLARGLKIKESQIDDLEQKHARISDRVREILLYYEKTNVEGNWFGLMDALTESRRKDLSNKVKDILMRYHVY